MKLAFGTLASKKVFHRLKFYDAWTHENRIQSGFKSNRFRNRHFRMELISSSDFPGSNLRNKISWMEVRDRQWIVCHEVMFFG